jgi:hypothetical protein
MKHAFLAIAAGAILQISCGTLGDRLTFRAKVADVQHRTNSLLKSKQPGDYVEINLPGKLLNPTTPVNLISRSQADWSTPEYAAASILSASAAGDPSWMIENYVPSERETVSKRLSDPDVLRTTVNYYQNVGRTSVTGWAELRGFTVVFIQGLDEDGDATMLALALSKTPTGWRQTDALAHDDTFEIVWTALHTGGVR